MKINHHSCNGAAANIYFSAVDILCKIDGFHFTLTIAIWQRKTHQVSTSIRQCAVFVCVCFDRYIASQIRGNRHIAKTKIDHSIQLPHFLRLMVHGLMNVPEIEPTNQRPQCLWWRWLVNFIYILHNQKSIDSWWVAVHFSIFLSSKSICGACMWREYFVWARTTQKRHSG